MKASSAFTCRSSVDESKRVDRKNEKLSAALVHGDGNFKTMHLLKAHVKSGRITLDEATDLPDGDIYLVPADALDEMDEDERAALHEALAESVEQMKRGELIDADVALAKLRAHR